MCRRGPSHRRKDTSEGSRRREKGCRGRRPRAPLACVARTGWVPRLSRTMCQANGNGDNRRGSQFSQGGRSSPARQGAGGWARARAGGPRCDGEGRQARPRFTHTRGSCSGGAPRLWNTPSTKTPFLPRQRR